MEFEKKIQAENSRILFAHSVAAERPLSAPAMAESPSTNFKKRLTNELVLQRAKCDHLSQARAALTQGL